MSSQWQETNQDRGEIWCARSAKDECCVKWQDRRIPTARTTRGNQDLRPEIALLYRQETFPPAQGQSAVLSRAIKRAFEAYFSGRPHTKFKFECTFIHVDPIPSEGMRNSLDDVFHNPFIVCVKTNCSMRTHLDFLFRSERAVQNGWRRAVLKHNSWLT